MSILLQQSVKKAPLLQHTFIMRFFPKTERIYNTDKTDRISNDHHLHAADTGIPRKLAKGRQDWCSLTLSSSKLHQNLMPKHLHSSCQALG